MLRKPLGVPRFDKQPRPAIVLPKPLSRDVASSDLLSPNIGHTRDSLTVGGRSSREIESMVKVLINLVKSPK